MIKIFAKNGTSEKVLIVCEQSGMRDIQIMLGKKFGGAWVLCDSLISKSEFLKFDDGLEYRGFHGKDERYVKGIENCIMI